jgi:hypothetical protein
MSALALWAVRLPCEDRGPLSAKSISQAYPNQPRPIWDSSALRGLFKEIDQVSPGLKIEQYNGAQLTHDDVLDKLKVPDEVCKGLDRLAAYEYRPPALDDEIAAGTAPKLIDVEILGHIFEQSISELEQLHQETAKGGGTRACHGGPAANQNEATPFFPIRRTNHERTFFGNASTR